MRVLIFGIDGGTLDLVKPWARQGELPHLARLMGEGATGVLQSTIHPLTPQAWASFLTGMNPGKHGVFDFGRRQAGSYELELSSSRTRRAPAIWDYLEPHDLSCGVINVPLTFPLEPVPGFMISGMHTPSLAQGVGPASLLQEIQRVAPDYRIDVMAPWYRDPDHFLDDVHAMTAARGRLAAHLYREHRPDLFTVVMVAVDRVCHAFYKQMEDPQDPATRYRTGWKYRDEVLRAYRAVDRELGRLLEQIDDQTVVIVMSDHGFGTLEGEISLNQLFLEQGLMSFSVEKVRRRLPVWELPFGVDRGMGAAMRDAVIRAVPPLRRRSDRRVVRGEIPTALRTWDHLDWERTVAYSHGFFGNVYLNLEGREPQGCVPQADYHRVRDEVAGQIEALRDPQAGGPLVERIYRREELYAGPFLDEAPDLVVVMRDYAYITRGGSELSAREVIAAPMHGQSGNHRREGMLIMWGPGIRAGIELPDAQITDILPTALSLLGIPLPHEIDGRVIEEAFVAPCRFITGSATAKGIATALLPSSDRELSADEERQIRRRLKNLGYLE